MNPTQPSRFSSVPAAPWYAKPGASRSSGRWLNCRAAIARERRVFDVVPPHVERQLRPEGQRLEPVMHALEQFGERCSAARREGVAAPGRLEPPQTTQGGTRPRGQMALAVRRLGTQRATEPSGRRAMPPLVTYCSRPSTGSRGEREVGA